MGTVAPWCLGVGLAATTPVSAGVDIASGGTIAPLGSLPAFAPGMIPLDLAPGIGASSSAFSATHTTTAECCSRKGLISPMVLL